MTSLATPEPSYDIAPEDAAYAAKVDAVPMEAVRNTGGIEFTPSFKISGLSPEHQREAHARLAGLSPAEAAAKESAVVASVIRDKITPHTFASGLSDDALPHHREVNEIRLEIRDAEREVAKISEDLAEVVRYDTTTDPATGKPVAVPVMKLTGEREMGALNRRAALMRKLDSLCSTDGKIGHEADRRLKKAKFDSVQLLKKREEEAADNAAAKALAAKMLRDEKIEAQAKSLANMRRNGPRR